MVDRVYRADLPRLRTLLLKLRKEFTSIDPSTDWVGLRIDPLLAHVDRLTTKLRIWDAARLRGVVPMLHSDLVYLRQNVLALQRALDSEKKRSRRPRGTRNPPIRVRSARTPSHPTPKDAGD